MCNMCEVEQNLGAVIVNWTTEYTTLHRTATKMCVDDDDDKQSFFFVFFSLFLVRNNTIYLFFIPFRFHLAFGKPHIRSVLSLEFLFCNSLSDSRIFRRQWNIKAPNNMNTNLEHMKIWAHGDENWSIRIHHHEEFLIKFNDHFHQHK